MIRKNNERIGTKNPKREPGVKPTSRRKIQLARRLTTNKSTILDINSL
ncbi:hypothetical protein SM124_08930 [Bacillus sp. 31A1R]|uniref:Uncharacterized protein n=1 Tax=Robertmurraya mangrovi TaxID=3098077 RepID=A0ABU5IXJ5_9BACI|nr:hypothetical protein [Bacillus sp. 31A1R]